jgi:D-galactarolactone cycloisomerase
MNQKIEISKLECFVFRAPIKTPVQTSFGIMVDRPMVLVRIEDSDGCFGWGEIWCNFPSVGAEHRARLAASVFAPLLVGASFTSPQEVYQRMFRSTEVLAIQSGEFGPIAHVIAGVDTAVWDLAARRQSLPVWKLLGGTQGSVAVYASGLNPTSPEIVAKRCFEKGYRAFKLKIGFGDDVDLPNLEKLRSEFGMDVMLMADANQGWTLDQALVQVNKLAPFKLRWLEEPLRADRPLSEWTVLAKTGIPLAAGENMASEGTFAAAIASSAISVIQPDLAKWGGFTKCLPIAKDIIAANLVYCPHYLGGGLGLVASAHCLAAAGGNGMLEIDGNENPLRNLLCGSLAQVRNGRAELGLEAGLGVLPDLEMLQEYRIQF